MVTPKNGTDCILGDIFLGWLINKREQFWGKLDV